MLIWAKHKVTTSIMIEQPKSELAEPLEAARQDVTPPIALKLTTEMPKAINSTATSP